MIIFMGLIDLPQAHTLPQTGKNAFDLINLLFC